MDLEGIKENYWDAVKEARRVGAQYGDSHKEWLIAKVEQLNKQVTGLLKEFDEHAEEALQEQREIARLREALEQADRFFKQFKYKDARFVIEKVLKDK